MALLVVSSARGVPPPLPGPCHIQGHLTEEVSGDPMPGRIVQLGYELNITCDEATSGADGYYEFPSLAPGVYFLWVQPSTYYPRTSPRYYHFVIGWGENSATCDFVLLRADLVREIEIIGIKGWPPYLDRVGNTETIQLRGRWRVGVTDPTGVYEIKARWPGDPEHGQLPHEVSLLPGEWYDMTYPDPLDPFLVEARMDVWWPTTACFNETYDLTARMWCANPYGTGTLVADDTRAFQVANMVLKGVLANSGNADYTKYDPDNKAGQDWHHPWIEFTIKDLGQTCRRSDGEPYQYRWEIWPGPPEGTPFVAGLEESPTFVHVDLWDTDHDGNPDP